MAPQPRRRSFLLLLLLALVAGGVMIARSALDGDPGAGEELAGKSEAPPIGTKREPAGDLPVSRLEAAVPEEPSEQPTSAVVPFEFVCLHHTELRAVSGIHLYRDGASIAGPSPADGILRFEPGPPAPLTASSSLSVMLILAPVSAAISRACFTNPSSG